MAGEVYYCGKVGRLRVGATALTTVTVFGINAISRNRNYQKSDVVYFDAPADSNGNPIAGVCTGPVTITYSIEGYFMKDPATGVDYTPDVFSTDVFMDMIIDKTGPNLGIKGVLVRVLQDSIKINVNNPAAYSCEVQQISADPSPLVA